MRFHLILFMMGVMLAGCFQPDAGGLPQDGAVSPPVSECIGPVCGTDGATYATDCEAGLAGAEVDHMGACMPLDECVESGPVADGAAFVEKGGEAFRDHCDEQGRLRTYACVDGEAVSALSECADGQVCLEGRCVQAPEPETPEAPEAGCHGPYYADIHTRDRVTFNGVEYLDECIEFRVVKDYLCREGALEAVNHQCPPGYGCMQGACVEQQMVCREDDVGRDIYNRSRTVVSLGLGTVFDEIDECVDEVILREHYCGPDGNAITEEMECPSGTRCQSGKCVKSRCSETDGGFDIYVFGVTSASGVDSRDRCINDDELREYYCYGDIIRDERVHCGSGYICFDGECIEGSLDD